VSSDSSRATWGNKAVGGEGFPHDVRWPDYIEGGTVRFFLGRQKCITIACLLHFLYALLFVLLPLSPQRNFQERLHTFQPEHTQLCLPLFRSLVRGPRRSSPSILEQRCQVLVSEHGSRVLVRSQLQWKQPLSADIATSTRKEFSSLNQTSN
jgi:hypothetical protein